MWSLVAKVRGNVELAAVCNSQNTLNDTHTYKWWGGGGGHVNAPPRSTNDDGPTESRYIYIAIRSEHK